MFFLILCFIIQFIIACVCLGVVSVNSQFDILNSGWQKLNEETIRQTQIRYNCCGFKNITEENRVQCPRLANKPCFEDVQNSVAESLKTTGIVGLIFCFTNVSKKILHKKILKILRFKKNYLTFSYWESGSQ